MKKLFEGRYVVYRVVVLYTAHCGGDTGHGIKLTRKMPEGYLIPEGITNTYQECCRAYPEQLVMITLEDYHTDEILAIVQYNKKLLKGGEGR